MVGKIEKPKDTEGFIKADVFDDFLFKGEVKFLPEEPIYVGNYLLSLGNIVAFAKYSPDTHEIEIDGDKLKFVHRNDVLAVL